ncbi:MAG: alpha/beta hydrolase [Terrimicrobiaceae bacterium]|nr:alpha/beta hydrolase [Terrimicrobiaceae bacterium]
MKRIPIAIGLLFLSNAAGAAIHKNIAAKTPDGLNISAQEYGNPQGPEIVLIHGLGQSHLSWKKQVESPLAKDFRILTYDLRGHADSDKPSDKSYYEEGKRWGDELKAVIDAAGFKKPTLVGWSLGGVIIANYLHTYGDKDLSGVVLVDAVVGFKAEFFGPGPKAGLVSDDLEPRVRGIAAFLRACFAKQPPMEDFELMLAYNAMVPREVQRAVKHVTIEGAEVAFRQLKVPTLIIQGEEDALVTSATALYAKNLIKPAKLSFYPRVGHAPFYENPEQFNADLRALLKETLKPGPQNNKPQRKKQKL